MDLALALTPAQALWFLPPVLPICLWVAVSDLRTMRIPNVAVLALAAVFLALGLIVLPFDAYLWRLAALAVVLVAGFVIASLGLVGAGDAKFAAAMAPFIAPGDALFFLMLFAVVLIVSFAAHRAARATPAIRRATPGWVSWERGKLFPMGVPLALALALYLALGLMA